MTKKRIAFVSVLLLMLIAAIVFAACSNDSQKFTVSFEVNGGAAVSEMTASEGNSIELPETSKEGFTFVGWFDNAELSGNKVDSPYTPTANTKLYAKWSQGENPMTTYTVSFEVNGGAAVSTRTVNEGDNIELPETSKEGFTFVGWFDNVELSGNKVSSPYTPTS